MGRSELMLSVFMGFLVLGVTTSSFAFAEPGEFEPEQNNNQNQLETFSLDLIEPEPIGVTYFGNGGYSADAYGDLSAKTGTVQVEIPSDSTIEQAYAYVPKFGFCNLSTNTISIAGNLVTVDRIAQGIGGYLCTYKADVTQIVKNDIGFKSGIVDVDVAYPNSPSADGVALVVIYSNPNSPEVSIAVMDGGQETTGDSFLLGLAGPLDKNIQGFSATMSVGIGFGYQGSGDIHKCGTGQTSQIDVNGQRLTSCAGHYDDGAAGNGALITVGGVGDNIDNPPNPNGSGGQDDELYDISDFLNNGDTQILVETKNPSNNDIIFLSIFELTAKVSVGEICGDGIDNDEDGSIDEGCQVEPSNCVDYNFNENLEEKTIQTYAFNSDISNWSGYVAYESVQGFTADGFDGNFLRNPTNPPQKTTLTLTDLPDHDKVDIGFLLAIIDSWDGSDGSPSPDVFNVAIDGQTIFSETFAIASGTGSYVPPANVEIANKQQRGFNGGWTDSSYNMANEPAFQSINHTASDLTLDIFASGAGWQGGSDESWAIDNFQLCVNAVAPPQKKSNGGDNNWDTRPTFGISHEDRENQVVENGFRFNNEEFTLTDNHWTPFEEQSVEIGTTNSFSATVYADKRLKVQEFLFGIPTVGEAQLAELGVEVWYDFNGDIEDVKVVQKSDVIDADTVSVSHEKVKCLSIDEEAKCDTTTVSMTFLEPLKDKVMAIKAIDFKNRDQRTFLNEGFDISGDSLNPMENKMIPSNVRNEGLLKVTQVAKYSPYWVADDGRMFEMNSFGSFKQVNQSFERFADTGDARTRQHSGFGGIIQYEQNRATQVFDSTKLISDLPDSFGYHFDMTERFNEEMKQKINEQQEIAKEILKEMDKQNRYY
jgi:hypothetical protein